MFRSGRFNEFHIVVVNSNGAWYHYLRTGDVDTEQDLAAEYSNHIDTTPYGNNHIRIIAKGTKGWLFINGAFVGNLDLSGLTGTGSVSAVGAYFQGDGIAGQSTRFEDFTIRSLRKVYGPMDGSMQHDPEDRYIEVHHSATSISDGIFEARFHNPFAINQGNWSHGFQIRTSFASQSHYSHYVFIQQNGQWRHNLRLGTTEWDDDLAGQYSFGISTAFPSSNLISVIALGTEGWLFINDHFIEKLDLSGWVDKGEARAGIEFINGSGISGYSTRFEDFTIWSAD